MTNQKSKIQYTLVELAHHLPYSIFGVISAMVVMAFLTFIAEIVGAEGKLPQAAEEMFHIFHPSHILVSAVVTTAMFWKHDNRSLLKAIVIGLVGSVGICALSDIFFPFIGGILLGYRMQIHVCLIEEPFLIISFALAGVLSGLAMTSIEKATQYSHGVHVFLSSIASLLYLIGFGLNGWTHAVAGVFLVTVIAVIIPCCTSDIVFPLMCTHRYCQHEFE